MKFANQYPYFFFSKTLPFTKKKYLIKNVSFPFKYDLSQFHPEVAKSFNYYQQIEQFEFVLNFNGKVIIEPIYGWPITFENELIAEFSRAAEDGLVNYPSYIHTLLFSINKTVIDKAISIRFDWVNYFHFFNDVLGQILLVDQIGIPIDIPIIIPSWALDLKHVKYFMHNLSCFSGRQYIIQKPREVIEVVSLFLLQKTPNIKEIFQYTLDNFPNFKNIIGGNIKKNISYSKEY